MPELELTRTREDRKLYALEGVGTLRLNGWMARSATATAGDRTWALRRRGVFKTTVEATDAEGAEAGLFEPRVVRRGGELTWDGRTLTLRPASVWKERYALAEGERELAVLDGRAWGRRPVTIVVEDLAAVEPGLLLFAAYVVRGLAEDASGAAAGGTAAATSVAASG
ncbi:MAG TPA: hypothetical protein VNT55_14530 [Baekduia sp.]|nr:hypothetical protein [Baekduia sp.]